MHIYGQRRTGKSVALRHLLHDVKDWYKKAYVFSETIHLQPDLFDYIPKHNQFNSFDQYKLQEIYNEQETYILKNISAGKKKEDLNYVLVLFDDCINDTNFRSSEILKRIHISGRHVNYLR
jgi:hypothetical protein